MSVNKVLNTGELQVLAGGTLYAAEPVGSVKIWMSNTIPNGYLLCNGQAVSKTTYADLYAVIGSTFGETDTTFNVPDLREAVPVGTGTRGSGVATHDTYTVGQFKDDQVQDHTHVYLHIPQDTYSDLHIPPSGSGYAYGNLYTYSTGTPNSGRHGDTTHGKQLGVNYIIKATTIALPSDFEDAVEDAVTDVYGDLIPSSASASNKLVTAAQNNFTYILRSNTVSDLNTLTAPGVYTFTIEVADVTTAHAPTSGWLQVYVTRANNDAKYVQQMCISQGGNLYVRTSQNDNWAAWKQATMT